MNSSLKRDLSSLMGYQTMAEMVRAPSPTNHEGLWLESRTQFLSALKKIILTRRWKVERSKVSMRTDLWVSVERHLCLWGSLNHLYAGSLCFPVANCFALTLWLICFKTVPTCVHILQQRWVSVQGPLRELGHFIMAWHILPF